MPQPPTLVEESQVTLDVMDSLPRPNVLPMVLLALLYKPVPHIQSKLDVLKEQTDYVSMICQLDKQPELKHVELRLAEISNLPLVQLVQSPSPELDVSQMEPIVSLRLPVHHIQIKKPATEVVQMEYALSPQEVLQHQLSVPVN